MLPLNLAAQTTLEQVSAVHEKVVESLANESPMPSVGIGAHDGEIAVLIGAVNSPAANALRERYPAGARVDGILIHVEVVGVDQSVSAPVTDKTRAQAAAREISDAVRAERSAKLRSTLVATGVCNTTTQELNNGARGTPTSPCVVIYPQTEAAFDQLSQRFGAEHAGVPVIYVASSPEPLKPFDAKPATCEKRVGPIRRQLRKWLRRPVR